MEKIIDLHIHTTCSDGALSPKQVVDEAIKNGVDTIAIADHDTTAAYTEDLFNYAKEKGINLIPAVEISTKINKCGIHVLGYNFDLQNEELLNQLSLLRNARHDYLYNVSAKIKELGYKIDVESLDKIDAVTKAHIALDVVNNSENEELLIKTFGHIPDKGEFIETIMNENCPAYVKKATITPSEASKLIKKAGGKVVLAHPVAYKYEDNLTLDDIEKLIQDMQPLGIEGNYIYHDRNNNKINEVEFWNKFAQDHNLLSTIGSDFHKEDGIHTLIGLIGEELPAIDSQKILDTLKNS